MDLDGKTSVHTLMEVNVKYMKDEGDFFPDPTLYQCLVGSLIYLTTIRPEILYVVHLASLCRLLDIFFFLLFDTLFVIL